MPQDLTDEHTLSLPGVQPSAPVPGLVSVTLAVYNGGRDVREAIESVLAQTYVPLELIVVDDGSTDDTWPVLQSFGERIRKVRQDNKGHSVARNAAISHARGEFIAIMDHDDICMPERIAVQVALLRAHPEVGLCCSDFSAFDSNGPISESYIGTYYSSCAPQAGGPIAHYRHVGTLEIGALLARPVKSEVARIAYGPVYEAQAHGNIAHPPTVMVRASVLALVGGFDPHTRSVSDWDWLIRIAKVSQFGYVDRPLLQYRRSQSQMSSHKERDSLDALFMYVITRTRDPALAARHRRSLNREMGRTATDAAYATAERRPWFACGLLAQAVFRYGVINRLAWRALVKILVPNRLLDAVRARRAANHLAR